MHSDAAPTIAVVLLMLFATINTSIAPPGGLIITNCYEVDGTIIDMTNNSTLWVELDYMEEVRGYKVYVSEEAYEDYYVGENYNEIVCDYIEYAKIQDYIDNLTEWGLVEVLV